MSTDLTGLARTLILIGAVLGLCGAVLLLAPKVPWIGRLPGDLLIKRDHLTVYVPLATCLVASLVLSLVCWLLGRFR